MTQKRFLKSVLKAAKTETVRLPFTRGVSRRAFIAKRIAAQTRLKSA